MSKKIMIIEDDQSFHDLYTELLEDTDYSITCTYDGEEAMEKLEEDKPDLIILDMLLDLMAGDTFFRLIRNMPEYVDIPIIVVSGYPEQAYVILKDMDKSLTFLNKTDVCDKLIGEIRNRIG
ncbi:MAG: response regulator [Candidatus Scalindua sp.]|jgi:CheY-like chemotaxis protein|nr:response regulator [Candidatus Scalindua sp.]